MKLQNKKTGEIRELIISTSGDYYVVDYNKFYEFYDSPTELAKEWEDYEEPKKYWAIDCFVPDDDLVSQFSNCCKSVIENRKSIGNYFETEEEAEKTVEKLKAWKRLKDKGFKFDGYEMQDDYLVIKTNFHRPLIGEKLDLSADNESEDLLTLLFGGKE